MTEELSKMEKARKLIGDIGPALEKSAKEKGWDIGLDKEFEEDSKSIPTPKVRLKRKARVGDSIQAEDLAKMHFGQGRQDYELKEQHFVLAKMALLCTFDGEVWNIPQIERLGGDFFTHVVVMFAAHLQ